MVLADGSFVMANNEENSDLYWAVRGGGGNFGVVTCFEFRLRPVDVVQFGPCCSGRSDQYGGSSQGLFRTSL